MPSKYLDESVLLVGLKAEKPKAFIYLYENYKYWMMLEAYAYLNDELVSQDLVQELLIDFWEHKLHENVLINLKGYLIVMIRNRSMNYLRKLNRQKNRIAHHITVEELVLPDMDLQRAGLSQQIEQAIQKLPPRTKNAFIYCYIETAKSSGSRKLIRRFQKHHKGSITVCVKNFKKRVKNLLSD